MHSINRYEGWVSDIYDSTPKAVFAAIAVSFAVMHSGDEDFAKAQDEVLREWWTLYDNGIIPQKPRKPRPASAVEAS